MTAKRTKTSTSRKASARRARPKSTAKPKSTARRKASSKSAKPSGVVYSDVLHEWRSRRFSRGS